MNSVKKRNIEPIYIYTPRIHLTLNDREANAVCDHLSLADLDVVIPRIGRSLTKLGGMVLKHFELMNVPTTLSMIGLLTARNKYLTLQALHEANIRIPESVLIASRNRSEELTEYLSPPMVLKLLTGTQGIGVMLVKDVKEAGPIIDTLSELDQMICIQRYLPNSGEDIRVFVTGGEVVAAMKRRATDHEWRSNIHIGGQGTKHQITPEESEVSIKAAEAVGVEIAGVDLISVNNVPHVIEVNASPGFQGLLKATGVNAADKIVEYAVAKAKR